MDNPNRPIFNVYFMVIILHLINNAHFMLQMLESSNTLLRTYTFKYDVIHQFNSKKTLNKYFV